MTHFKTLLSLAALFTLFVFCKSPEGLKSGYHVENNKVYHYSGFPATKTLMENAEADTFISINDDYAKDRNNVYYGTKKIDSADVASFEVLGGPFSRDKRNGYFQETIISRDGPGFGIITAQEYPTGTLYARDGKNVFRSNNILENADPLTFRFVSMFNGNYLTYDKNTVYFNDLPVTGTNGSAFKKVTGHYFKDDKNVWALILGKETAWTMVTGADAVTFEGYKEYYAKDKNKIYYEDKVVDGADLKTFEETDNGEAKDAIGNFEDGKRKK